MEIKKESITGLKHLYQVSVLPEIIELKIKNRLLEMGGKAKIPGFRPGKAPLIVLQQHYEASVRPEVVRGIIDDSYRQILKDKKLRPASYPEITVDSYAANQALECTYVFEILPEIQEIDLKKLPTVEHPTADVEDPMIEEVLQRIATTNKTTTPLSEERPCQKGDTVTIDFEGRTVEGPISGGSGKGIPLELGSGYFIPGFEEQLEGMAVGEHKTIQVTFPKDYSAKDLAGKKATFAVTLHKVEQTVIPKIGDDFAKKIGFGKLGDLKEAIKHQLESENARKSFLIAKKRILDILDGEKIDLPQNLVDHEMRQIQGESHTHATPEEKEGCHDCEEHSKNFEHHRPLAERRVRLGLILADIGNKNNIEVTSKEMQQAIVDQARRYPGEEKKVMDYFQKNTQAQNTLRAPIFEDKVIKMILEKGNIQQKKVSQKELEKIFKEIVEG